MKSSTASSPRKWDSDPATRPGGVCAVRSLVRRRFARPAGALVARIAAAHAQQQDAVALRLLARADAIDCDAIPDNGPAQGAP